MKRNVELELGNHKVTSFGRAVYEGVVDGPANFRVMDGSNHRLIYPAIEKSPYSRIVKEVEHRVRSVSGQALSTVIDFQYPDQNINSVAVRAPREVPSLRD